MIYVNLMRDISLAVAPLLLAAATGLVGKGTQYALHAVARIRSQNLREGLDWAIHLAGSVVQSAVVAANQTTVNDLKSAGQFGMTEAHRVFETVLASVTVDLGTEAQSQLATEVPDVPAFLRTLIESAVAEAPNRMASHAVPASNSMG